MLPRKLTIIRLCKIPPHETIADAMPRHKQTLTLVGCRSFIAERQVGIYNDLRTGNDVIIVVVTCAIDNSGAFLAALPWHRQRRAITA